MIWLFIPFALIVVGLIVGIVGFDKRRQEMKFDAGLLPDLVLWDREKMPFSFIIDPDCKQMSKLTDAVVWAVGFWNNAVPGIFPKEDQLTIGGAVVPIMPMSNLQDIDGPCCNAFGYTRLTMNPSTRQVINAAIYIDEARLDNISDLSLRRAMAHEFGHVLGLAHDEIRSSVMYKAAFDKEPMVTANDRALLKGFYT